MHVFVVYDVVLRSYHHGWLPAKAQENSFHPRLWLSSRLVTDNRMVETLTLKSGCTSSSHQEPSLFSSKCYEPICKTTSYKLRTDSFNLI